MKKIITFIAILLFAAKAFAGTYYVSPDGTAPWPSCTNSSSPCSLATANANAIAGDTILLRGGTYTLSGGNGIAPAHSGTLANKITYAAAPGEIPIITQSGTSSYGLLINVNYIIVDGITFQDIYAWIYMQYSASYNEIKNCVFKSTSQATAAGVGVFMMGCTCPTKDCWLTHNWFHHNTFSKKFSGNPCGEATDIMKIGCAPGSGYGPDESNYNTVENNYFEYAAHALFDQFGRFTVFKNNVLHNEPWMTGCTSSTKVIPNGIPTYENPAYNGKFGHRCVQVTDGYSRDATYVLVEGNRIGHAGVNPNNAGPSNLDLAAPKNIVRYNFLYNGMQSGIFIKYAGATGYPGRGGMENRIYNNTIYHHGYGFDWVNNWINNGFWRSGQGITQYTSGANSNNVIKNNLLYDNHDGDICWLRSSIGCSPSSVDIVTNNWMTTNGDPKFVNPDLSNTSSSILPDLSLQASSGAINGGTYLTTAVGAGTNSTTLVVTDALYFQDGTWGSLLARNVTHFPDWIAIGTVGNVVKISSINYTTKTITLASAKTWSNGASIWLYKKSDGVQVLYGTAPDMGAYEYSGATSLPPPPRQ